MPAPTVATPPATDTESIGETSMSSPVVDERPAKQWPPLRTATGSPDRRACASAAATSSGLAQRAMACGRISWKRASAGLRAAS